MSRPAQGVSLRMHILALQPPPIVIHVKQLAADMVGPFRSQKQSKLNLFFRENSPGKPDIFGFFDFAATRALAGMQDLIRHMRVRAARGYTIDLHIVIPNLFGDGFDKAHDSSLGSRVGREPRPSRRRSTAADDNNLAMPLL